MSNETVRLDREPPGGGPQHPRRVRWRGWRVVWPEMFPVTIRLADDPPPHDGQQSSCDPLAAERPGEDRADGGDVPLLP